MCIESPAPEVYSSIRRGRGNALKVRDIRGLMKRFSKEIIIALILSIISAIAFEYMKDEIHEKRIHNNLNAVATIVT
jgi:hypothetical protein